MICRKVFFLAGLTLCVSLCSFSQTVISARNGSWNDPATWDGGIVPTISNSSLVRVGHIVSIDTGEVRTYSLEISGTLIVSAGAHMHVLSVDGTNGFVNVAGGNLEIEGSLTGYDGVRYTTTSSDTRFAAGSVFHFLGGPRAYIPIAEWDPASTFWIQGFRSSGYVALAFSDGWKQNFGDVVYDCPFQTTFVDLNGHLKNIHGNFLIRNTNSNALRLSTTQRPLISIGGDLTVEGPSELWCNTTGDSTRIYIGGDFIYNSTSTGPTYLATRGRTFVRIAGKLSLNSSGPLRMCSGSVDSTGIRRTTFEIGNGVDVLRGSLIAPSPGRGVMILAGSDEQQINSGASAFNGAFDFHIPPSTTVDFGTSVAGGTGSIFLKGHMKLGSPSLQGALSPTDGNIRVSGERYFYPGSTIEYSGAAAQYVGNTHPDDPDINLICSNPVRITLLKDIGVNDFICNSPVIDTQRHGFIVYGNVILSDSTAFADGARFQFAGERDQNVSFSASVIDDVTVAKSPGAEVNLLNTLYVKRKIALMNPSNTLNADGNLVLLSAADAEGATAFVASIPPGSSIEGEVVVQRHMAGEGRMYRYISSPVSNETVAGLKDDFPVTGTFDDPSTGPGLNSTGPSLFYFDDNAPVESSGWKPYPVSGAASDNGLMPGRGYAAFIREAAKPTILDFKGRLNQGEIIIPVQFSEGAGPENRGWNLVGNPYASAISWTLGAGWSKSPDISVPFAIRDNAEGRFRYFDGEVGDIQNGMISSGQAFWIRTSAQAPALAINEHAKAEEGAEFYREGSIELPSDYLMLTLDGPAGTDNVFIRKRLSASSTLDKFDALKMSNDHVTFSVLSDDSSRLAIYASEDFDCHEQRQLVVDFSRNGSGGFSRKPFGRNRINIEKFGLFTMSKVVICDRFLNLTSDSSTYEFTITDDERSFDPYRFSLVIKSDSSITFPTIAGKVFHCRDSSRAILLENVTQHFRYAAICNGSFFTHLPDTLHQEIHIPVSYFTPNATNQIRMEMQNACLSVLMDSLTIFHEALPEPPVIVSAIQCGGNPAKIVTRSTRKTRLDVFIDSLSESSLFSTFDSVFYLENRSDERFYIASTRRDGCASSRTLIDVERRIPDQMLWEENGKLFSSYRSLWFFEGAQLSEDTIADIVPPRTGLYTTRTMMYGCDILSNLFYTAATDGTDLFPVPFNDALHIRLKDDDERIEQIIIMDVDGRIVSAEAPLPASAVTLSMRNLQPGIYLVEIIAVGKRYRARISKE
jgi:hypothetical protein